MAKYKSLIKKDMDKSENKQLINQLEQYFHQADPSPPIQHILNDLDERFNYSWIKA